MTNQRLPLWGETAPQARGRGKQRSGSPSPALRATSPQRERWGMQMRDGCSLAILVLVLSACSGGNAPPATSDADADGFTAPTRFTREANEAVAKNLPLDDPAD